MTGNVDTNQPTARCPFSNPRELFDDLADARRTEGLTFSETLNSYVVSRYDEIVEAVGRPDLYSSTATIPDPPRSSWTSSRTAYRAGALCWASTTRIMTGCGPVFPPSSCRVGSAGSSR